MNPDRLAELEEERRFLLDSIRDLDRELAAGDVDQADHAILRDGYVARAAAVLREIEDGRNRLPTRAARPWWRRALVPVATLTVGGLLGWAVAQYAGQRLPGQTITGGPEIDAVSAKLSLARQGLTGGGEMWTQAAGLYAEVLELEPDNAEALTYLSWIKVLTGGQAGDADLVTQGVSGLRDAAGLDPNYADPVCLLSVALANQEPVDADGAREAGERCLAMDPPNDMVPMIEGMLDGLDASGG